MAIGSRCRSGPIAGYGVSATAHRARRAAAGHRRRAGRSRSASQERRRAEQREQRHALGPPRPGHPHAARLVHHIATANSSDTTTASRNDCSMKRVRRKTCTAGQQRQRRMDRERHARPPRRATSAAARSGRRSAALERCTSAHDDHRRKSSCSADRCETPARREHRQQMGARRVVDHLAETGARRRGPIGCGPARVRCRSALRAEHAASVCPVAGPRRSAETPGRRAPHQPARTWSFAPIAVEAPCSPATGGPGRRARRRSTPQEDLRLPRRATAAGIAPTARSRTPRAVGRSRGRCDERAHSRSGKRHDVAGAACGTAFAAR